jgi:hypothetical protein
MLAAAQSTLARLALQVRDRMAVLEDLRREVPVS